MNAGSIASEAPHTPTARATFTLLPSLPTLGRDAREMDVEGVDVPRVP